MKRSAVLLAVLAMLATGCSHPEDSPECKDWQSRYEITRGMDQTIGALLRSKLLKERPDGCPIP
jgi:hypothetical protein